MARIRGGNTRPERILAKALWATGLRYRLRVKCCGIRPDIVLAKSRTAIFVDGCFWHGCPEHYVRPRTRTRFWSQKLRENVLRDQRQVSTLKREGWRVVRVWEHQVYVDLATTLEMIDATIGGYLIQPTMWRVLEATPIDPAGIEESRILISLEEDPVRQPVTYKRHTRKW